MKPPASANEAKPNVTTAIIRRLRRFWRKRFLQARANALMPASVRLDGAVVERHDPPRPRDDARIVRGEEERHALASR